MKKPTLKSFVFILFLTATCAPYIYTLDAAFADQDCVNCEAKTPKRPGLFSRLFGFIKGNKRQHQGDEAPIGERRQMCEDLNVGDYRRYNKAPASSPDWYRTGNYTIRRVADDRFQAILNLDFEVIPGATVGAMEMKDRFQKCMQSATPMLKGPNGEVLEVLVMTPDEVKTLPFDQRPKQTQIDIHKSGTDFLDSAKDFDENVNCVTITHELMHHLGLVDEYREERGNRPIAEWNCRVVTKVPSLMRDMTGMFNMVKAQSSSCDCSGTACKAMMSGMYPNAQKIFLGKTARLFINSAVQSKYCAPSKSLPNEFQTVDLPSSDRSVITLNDGTDGIYRFESRRIVDPTMQGQKYSVSRYETTCACSPADLECKKTMDDIVNKINTESLVSNICPDNVNPSTDPANSFTINTPAHEKSLLHPAQFQKIIYGTCERPDTAVMLKCEQFAYKGKSDRRDCQIPPECLDDRLLLGIKK